MIIKADIQVSSRLDRYLKRLYPNLTQGVIEKALRHKQIMVNSCKTTAGLRIVEGDSIFLDDSLNLQKNIQNKTNFSNIVVKLADKIIKNYLIYEDEYLIAINKPSGLATQGGSKIHLSINDALCYLNQFSFNDFKLVHRLDKLTSGILLIAKNYKSSIKLTESFQKKVIQKTYWAVVLGKPNQHEGKIVGLIGKNRNGVYETVQDDFENGKLAITHYKLLKTFNNDLSLIEFTPLTGRMHQLRLHAKLLNCPIIGDLKYGNPVSIAKSNNMLLHAKTIVLPQVVFGKEIIINAILPSYFLSIINI